jgi:glycosyltransferase involved in cell wall biosynthesis
MTRLWFDVGTIICWDRPANGVVRCEAEYAAYLLNHKPVSFVFCTFVGGVLEIIPKQKVIDALEKILDQFKYVPFIYLENAYLALAQTLGNDFDIADSKEKQISQIDTTDVYLSIGADWLKGPLIHLYEKKKREGFKVILCCYDTIPIFHAPFTLGWLADLFPQYLSSVAWSADAILCISKTTESDLIRFLRITGNPIPKTLVVSLGCEIRKSIDADALVTLPAGINRPYILFVSTIEIRKNHQILYRAYRYLLSQGVQDLPLLVLVGTSGWGVDELLNQIDDDEIKQHFLFLQKVGDLELAQLYRHALFTVYPSHYEGWGLPVAESLAFGKFCLASTAPSLREVGKTWVEYLDPLDEQLWAQKILWFYSHPEVVMQREERIETEFVPMSWSQACREITILIWTLLIK